MDEKKKEEFEKEEKEIETDNEPDVNTDTIDIKTEQKEFHGNLWKSIKLNWLFYITVIVCCIALSAHTGTSFTNHILTLIYASTLGYFIHYSSHKISFTKLYEGNVNYISENKILNTCVKEACRFLDFHDVTHHDTKINKEWYNILFEFINNFVMQGGLLVVLIYIAKQLSISSIILWALFYATVHNINYLYIKPQTHINHHHNKHTSYGLDIYDVLFNTKYDPDELEVYNHASVNVFLITIGIIYFISKK